MNEKHNLSTLWSSACGTKAQGSSSGRCPSMGTHSWSLRAVEAEWVLKDMWMRSDSEECDRERRDAFLKGNEEGSTGRLRDTWRIQETQHTFSRTGVGSTCVRTVVTKCARDPSNFKNVCVILFALISAHHVHTSPEETRRRHQIEMPWNWSYRWGWLPWGCWESNLGPLEPPVFITADPLLYPTICLDRC